MKSAYSSEQLRSIFQSSFNLDVWYEFLHKFFEATELKVKPELIRSDSTDDDGYYLGKIDKGDFRIGLFYYEIKYGSVVNRRVGLRNLVRSFINPLWGEFDAALVVFDSGDHWRFSFICDIKGEVTAPKRYTYVFGSSDLLYRTPIDRFLFLQSKGVSFENLKKAFSVEALSDEFFDKYREQYADFVQYITGKRVVKVSGKWEERVMCEPNNALMKAFDYDEKKIRDYIKKMMGRITFLHFLQRKGWLCGDLNYMQNMFERSKYKDNYLDAVLEPLFFGILNTKPAERRDLFVSSGWDLVLLEEWKDIPYLNGGLFERDKEDEPDSVFPAKYFSQLFQFFSEYNFTIDENDPNDAEVGVDPEMLGKIFENLLEDNKDKGAFYTPKEIVLYMCQESLIAYLETSTTIASDKLRKFVLSPEESVNDIPSQKLPKLVEALQNVKICDPAIGSGAFPMGLLNQLLRCREALSDGNYNRANLKQEIIQNNIYGVDIEKGAVDIARLRFWLSIVVDEDTPSPLPNLDYKIMQGNSLIESFEGVDLSNLVKKQLPTKNVDAIQTSILDEEIDIHQNKLSLLLSEYFTCCEHDRKVYLQNQISKSINAQLDANKINSDVLSKLKTINVAGNNQFFLWHTWFADVFAKGGFDIVIGNPPYISYYSRQAVNIDNETLEAIKNEITYLQKNKKTGRLHSLQFFIYKSLNIINFDGVCNLIIDFSFFEKPFIDIRKYNLENYHIDEIITGLTAFKNVSSGQLILEMSSKKDKQTIWKDDIYGTFQLLDLYTCLLDKECSISKPNKNENLLQTIESLSVFLSEIADVRTGVNIGGVKKYFLCDDDKFPPYISGGDNVQLYYINYPTKLQNKRGETNFKFDKKIEKFIWENKIGTPSIGENNQRFIRPKLVIRQSDCRITAALDMNRNFHCGYTLFTVNVEGDNLHKLFYILGIINSKLITFYMLQKGWIKIAPGKTPQIRVDDVKKIPIVFGKDCEMNIIVKIVDEIIILKKKDPQKDTSILEKQIDEIVYKIYGLTDAEIKVIEQSI